MMSYVIPVHHRVDDLEISRFDVNIIGFVHHRVDDLERQTVIPQLSTIVHHRVDDLEIAQPYMRHKA